MKDKRQSKILEIISKQNIETQNQLMDALLAEGVASTQATLSRDIKQLRLVKELAEDGSYRYAQPSKDELSGRGDRLRTIFRQGVISFDTAQNLIVIKTLPGLAMAACSALDKLDLPEVVGTLGGDDTCMVVLRDASSAAGICAEIRSQITTHAPRA